MTGNMIGQVALAIEEARARREAYGGIKLAKIAIAAMRRPTPMMLMRGSDTPGKPPKSLSAAWEDMIDAALRGE